MPVPVELNDGGEILAGELETAAGERLDPSVWKICFVAMLGSLLAQLDATIVNVSLSSLANDLRSSLSTIQWVASAYMLALALSLPLTSWLIDKIGDRRLYLYCFSTFTASSMLCGMAWSANSLIAFRVIQGLSGGLLAPMTHVMVTKAAGKHVTRVMGYLALPVMAAPILGPIMAGAILQFASWRWLFFINLPIGLLGIALAFRFLPNDDSDRNPRKLDWLGLVLLSPGLSLALFGVEKIGRSTGYVALSVGAFMLAAFLWIAKRKGDDALIDLRLFRNPLFTRGTAIMFLWSGCVYSAQMLVPVFLIQACGRAPAEMGWIMMPQGLGMLLTYVSLGTMTDRFGSQRVMIAGSALMFLATLPLIFLAAHGFDTALLLIALFFRGMGQSAIGVPAIAAAYRSLARRDLSMATTSLNIMQRLGGPTVTTLLASLLAWEAGASATHAIRPRAFVAPLALLCCLQAIIIVAAFWLERRADRPIA